MKSVFVVLLALAPLAAGCGSDPASLQGSDDALKDASTSRVEFKLEGKGVPYLALLRSTGSIDYANGRGEMLFTGGDPKSDARVLFVGHDGYFGAKIDGTMFWVKSSGESNRPADRFLPGASGMTPDRLLKDLTKTSKKVDEVGSEQIRGVATTHYRAHLDKSKFGSDPNNAAPDVVDAWIDDQGLPRRVRVPFGSEKDAGAEVVDLFDFGVPVDVQAPTADVIVSEEKFDALMEKECAKAKTAKDFEAANPLCLIFGVTLVSSEGGVQRSPDKTFPTTEGK
jgi:hypothetical protein